MCQELLHAFHPLVATADDRNGVPSRSIVFQLGFEDIHPAVEDRSLPAFHIYQLFEERRLFYRADERRQYIAFLFIEPEIIGLAGHRCEILSDASACRKYRVYIVRTFFFICLQCLEDPGRIVYEKLRIVHIVPDVHCLVIKIIYELFHVLQVYHALRVFQKLLLSLFEVVYGLAAALFLFESLYAPVIRSGDPLSGSLEHFVILCYMRTRIYRYIAERLYRALREAVECPYRVYFRVEQLHSVRIVTVRREDIYYSASDAVFSAAFYH